jgi:hypothetical protein
VLLDIWLEPRDFHFGEGGSPDNEEDEEDED